MTGEIAEIVDRRRQERIDLIPYIFHLDGRKMEGKIDRPWKKACIKAGVPDKLFHDLRRTAVRNDDF